MLNFQNVVELVRILDPTGEGVREALREIETNPEEWDLNEEEKQMAVPFLEGLLKQMERQSDMEGK